MTLNCRAHFRAVSTFFDFVNSVQFILPQTPYIQNTHDLQPFKGMTYLADGYRSLKSDHPSPAGMEFISVESDESAIASRPSFVLDPAGGQVRHSYLTFHPSRLHSCHIIIVGSYL